MSRCAVALVVRAARRFLTEDREMVASLANLRRVTMFQFPLIRSSTPSPKGFHSGGEPERQPPTAHVHG